MKYTRLARLVFVVVVAISLILAYGATRLELNYDFERFFPQGDPELEFYQEYRSKYEPDNDFTMIGIENTRGVFQKEFLFKIDSLSNRLDSLPFVTSVIGPTRLKYFVKGPFGPIQADFLHLDKVELYGADSIRVMNSELSKDNFFSSTRPAVAILVNSELLLSKAKCDTLALAIHATLGDFGFDKVALSGRIVGQRHFLEEIRSEMIFFNTVGGVVLIIILAFFFRTFWGVWVPLVVVGLAAIWILGLSGYTGKEIDPMGTLLPVILVVVGVSDVVHLLSKYLEELRWGKGKLSALRTTFKEVGMATFLTSLTTAIGFLTLLTSNIDPLREFGIYMAVGVLFAFILAFSILPAVLVLRPKPRMSETEINKVFWYRLLHPLFLFVIRNRIVILIVFVLVTGLSIIGINRIQADNYLLQDLGTDDPFRQDLEYFDTHFAGIRPMEMALSTDQPEGILSYPVLKEIDYLEQSLKETHEVGMIRSPLSLVKMANQAEHGGNPDHYKLPESEKEFKRLRPLVKRMSKGKLASLVLDPDGNEGRLNAKLPDRGGLITQRNHEKLKQKMERVDPGVLKTKVTGTAFLLDLNNTYLTLNLIYGLGIAFIAVSIVMMIIYKSPIMLIVSLIPNILPLLMVGGAMGFSGIDLNISTSIIYTIAFGIAVDDTIHFLSKFKIELNKGVPYHFALRRTMLSTGKAILVTSIILCLGFSLLLFSGFASTFYIGLLISLTLLFAVIADLTLLPVLMLVFQRWITRA